MASYDDIRISSYALGWKKEEMKVVCETCGGTGYIKSTLATIRKSKRLTQAQVADHLGMQRSAYAMLELGKASMAAHRILPLAKLLDIEVKDLLESLFGGGKKDE